MRKLEKAKGETITFVEGEISPSTGTVGLHTQLGGSPTTVSAYANTKSKNKFIETDIK